MTDPDNINPQLYFDAVPPVLRCPECDSPDLSAPDDEGLVDCRACGIWFSPGHPQNEPGTLCKKCGSPLTRADTGKGGYCTDTTCPFYNRWQSEVFNVDGTPSNVLWPELYEAKDPDDLNVRLYLAHEYPRLDDQLEERGFKRLAAGYSYWLRSVDPSWSFSVQFSRPDTGQRYWTLCVSWLPIPKVVQYSVHAHIPALMFDIDSSLRRFEGKRYLGEHDGQPVLENDASLPLALSLLEADDDAWQPALPFQPPVPLGVSYPRKLPFDPPLEPTKAPPPSDWKPPAPVYKQDPDDIDPQDYFDALRDFSERRIATSYTTITWHEPPDEDYDEEHGWENEEGEDLSVDEFDDEETTAVDKAVRWLQDHGAMDTGNNDWYSSEPHQDMYDGSTTEHSYHLKGYTEDELDAIYDRIVTHRRRWRQESADPDDPEAFLRQHADSIQAPVWASLYIPTYELDQDVIPPAIVDARNFLEHCSRKWIIDLVAHAKRIKDVSYVGVYFAENEDEDIAFDYEGFARLNPPPNMLPFMERQGYLQATLAIDIKDLLRWASVKFPPKKRIKEAADPDDPNAFLQRYEPPLSIKSPEFEALVDEEIERIRTYYSPDEMGPQEAYRIARDTVIGRLEDEGIELSESADPDDPEVFLKGYYKEREGIKEIEIVGRRWFQRTYGNTYHTARIYINDQLVHTCPMQYGYDSQYLWTAWEWLTRNHYVPPLERHEAPWTYASKAGIKLSYHAEDVRRQRDLHWD